MERDIESDKLLSQFAAILRSSFEIVNNFIELIRLKFRVVSRSVVTIFWLMGFIILLAISAWIFTCFAITVLLTQLGLSLLGALIAMLLIHLVMIGFCGVIIGGYKSNLNLNLNLMSSDISDSTRRN